MSLRASVASLREFQIEKHRRTVTQLETTIAAFDRLVDNLSHEIQTEEDRVKTHDPTHFAYPTFATAAIRRRDNLMRSSNTLKIQLDAARKTLGEATGELEAMRKLDANEPIEGPGSLLVLA